MTFASRFLVSDANYGTAVREHYRNCCMSFGLIPGSEQSAGAGHAKGGINMQLTTND
jgi:hypothetical protein